MLKQTQLSQQLIKRKYSIDTNGKTISTNVKEVIVISGNDYIKYMTQQVVTYIDLPRDERKSRKRKQNNNLSSFSNKWLGVLPFALKMFLKKAE